MIPTGFLGSYLGAELMHRLPMGAIKKLFALLLIVAAIKMAGSAISESMAESTPSEPDQTPATTLD